MPSWASVDPATMTPSAPAVGMNLVGGEWITSAKLLSIQDPLTGGAFMEVPDTSVAEVGPFIERMKSCPRSGRHNPIKNVQRYTMLGEVMADSARELKRPEVAEFFGKLIQRVVPKFVNLEPRP